MYSSFYFLFSIFYFQFSSFFLYSYSYSNSYSSLIVFMRLYFLGEIWFCIRGLSDFVFLLLRSILDASEWGLDTFEPTPVPPPLTDAVEGIPRIYMYVCMYVCIYVRYMIVRIVGWVVKKLIADCLKLGVVVLEDTYRNTIDCHRISPSSYKPNTQEPCLQCCWCVRELLLAI